MSGNYVCPAVVLCTLLRNLAWKRPFWIVSPLLLRFALPTLLLRQLNLTPFPFLLAHSDVLRFPSDSLMIPRLPGPVHKLLVFFLSFLIPPPSLHPHLWPHTQSLFCFFKEEKSNPCLTLICVSFQPAAIARASREDKGQNRPGGSLSARSQIKPTALPGFPDLVFQTKTKQRRSTPRGAATGQPTWQRQGPAIQPNSPVLLLMIRPVLSSSTPPLHATLIIFPDILSDWHRSNASVRG